MLNQEAVRNIYKGEFIGKEVYFLESIESTNDKAIEIAKKREDSEGIVVVADSQTHGKGRLGRQWISPPGVNLYFSVILKPDIPPTEAPLMTLAAAVAAASVLRTWKGVHADIKWPNDLMIKGKKVGGILTEMKTRGKEIDLVVVGIGLNVNMPLDELPEDIRAATTTLEIEKGTPSDRAGLLGGMLAGLDNAYKNLLNGNKRALINGWLSLNCTIGNRTIVQDRDRTITGVAENIGQNGELIVKLESGGTEVVNAGDVTVLKN